jgi:hypothetical protein
MKEEDKIKKEAKKRFRYLSEGFCTAGFPRRCPYTYESGSRVRLGELDSGARLGYIYI